jgi:hypothetical protein
MIYLKSTGRLGNQLFSYAFARKLQAERGDDTIVMDFGPYAAGESGEPATEGNQIQCFNITPNISFSYHGLRFLDEHLARKQKILFGIYKSLRYIFIRIRKLYMVLQHIFIPIMAKNGFYHEYSYTFGSLPKCGNKDIVIHGYFECAKYFSSIDSVIRAEFIPKNPPLPENAGLYKIIETEESVCVNVRRGDYLAPQNRQATHVCSENYYLRAMEEMKRLHPGAVFIVFSNDIVWCKSFFADTGYTFYFESGADPVWETLRLMYSCKHFIMSNSTFAWWAQYLSRHKNKTVIVPNRWRNWKSYSDSMLYEASFIKMPVD